MRKVFLILIAGSLLTVLPAFAREVEYKDEEIAVRVTPGEPTQLKFPGTISGGFKKKSSLISIDKKDSDLVVFAQEGLPANGEVVIVRLEDGRSYSVRVQRASADSPRDDVVKIEDSRPALLAGSSEDEPAYKEKNFQYAPPSQVSGLVREMVLASEFGKTVISGYKESDRYSGQKVLDDGTMLATIDKIYIGTNLWGYVLNVENLLEEGQKINPATFRLDGTRAVSASSWELTPRPLSVEQQVSGKHKGKLYIVTKAR